MDTWMSRLSLEQLEYVKEQVDSYLRGEIELTFEQMLDLGSGDPLQVRKSQQALNENLEKLIQEKREEKEALLKIDAFVRRKQEEVQNRSKREQDVMEPKSPPNKDEGNFSVPLSERMMPGTPASILGVSLNACRSAPRPAIFRMI
jgi:hypothetical protein